MLKMLRTFHVFDGKMMSIIAVILLVTITDPSIAARLPHLLWGWLVSRRKGGTH